MLLQDDWDWLYQYKQEELCRVVYSHQTEQQPTDPHGKNVSTSPTTLAVMRSTSNLIVQKDKKK